MSGPGARRAEPDEVRAALLRVAGHGPFFEVDVLDPAAGDGPRRGTSFAALYGPAGRLDLDEMVEHHLRRLRSTERRVGASLLFQGMAARLWSPVLGCLRDAVVPDLDPAHLYWRRGSPLGLGTDRLGGWVAPDLDAQLTLVGQVVIDAHLRPLTAALRECAPVAAGLLWGNAASALVGSAQVAGAGELRNLVLGLLARDPLRGTMSPEPTSPEPTSPQTPSQEKPLRRRSCCLFYRTPEGGYCGDCALAPVRRRRAG